MTREQQKFADIKNTTDYKVVGQDIDYKVWIDDTNKEVVLQFKESDSNLDWVNNLLFIPWPLKLGKKTVWTTLGYARAYKSAEDKPVQELIETYQKKAMEGYNLVIRGWSFGSAMAKIAGRHLEALGGYCHELTTYGDVKCWLNPFYDSKAARVREYTTSNDAVTWCVPFYSRDHKCKVGPRFQLKEVLKSEWYHGHYEDYDYSQYA